MAATVYHFQLDLRSAAGRVSLDPLVWTEAGDRTGPGHPGGGTKNRRVRVDRESGVSGAGDTARGVGDGI